MRIIETRDLSKNYSFFKKEEGLKGSIKSLFRRKKIIKQAVVNLNLEISEGEFVALIGPNGAGKTTLIKMLTGIIAPTSGYVSVLGHRPNDLKDAFKRQYAIVMGQKSQLFFELTAADSFRLLKEIYDIPEEKYRSNLEYFIDLFGVKDHMDVQVRTLSLGERMKMELIASLIHNPRVLFLDEPTIGLDAIAQKQIRGFLKKVNSDYRTTIILTSHYMEDIKSLCRRCIVVNDGQKIYDGDLEQLFDTYQTHKVITVSFDTPTDFILPSGAVEVERNPYKVSFKVGKTSAHAVLEEVMGSYDANDIAIEEEDIGNVVERIYSMSSGR